MFDLTGDNTLRRCPERRTNRPRWLLPAPSVALRSLALCLAAVMCGGCGPAVESASNVEVALTLEPSPPVVGDAEVDLKLMDASGAPLKGAKVRVEGNMNHAGMKPSFADLEEVEPGRYTGTLDFTMGGDWFLLVTANTADGKRVERKIAVKGVTAR